MQSEDEKREAKRYRAFISYSWADKAWGERIHRWLETYRIPAGAAGGERLGKFFRDDEDMAAAGDIGDVVSRALEASEALIVVCSPRAAQSRWVQAEIEHFKRVGDGPVFALIVDGAPNAADPAQECFPPALRRSDPGDPDAMPVEPVGIDVRRDGRHRALTRIAAGLLDVDFDDLWRRERRRAERRRRVQLGVVSGLALLFACLLVLAILNANRAHAALSRFFAERAWQMSDNADQLAAARYALAGRQLADQNEEYYRSALARTLFLAGETRAPLLHPGAVHVGHFSSDGGLVATGSEDGAVRIWDPQTGELRSKIDGHVGAVRALALDGNRLVSGGEDGTIRIHDLGGDAGATSIIDAGAGVVSLSILPGDRVLALLADSTVAMFDVESGSAIWRRQAGEAWSASPSPAGDRVVVAMEDGDAQVYDATDGDEILRLEGHGDAVLFAAYSPDGARIVTASADHDARIWQARDGKLLTTLQGHALEIYSAVFSPAGDRVVTASVDQTARIWDARSGREMAVLRGHSGIVTRATFSRDGAQVLTASLDGAARLWSASGEMLATLNAHGAPLTSGELSPGGDLALTAGEDGTARLWPLPRFRQLAVAENDGVGLASVEISGDGTQVLAGDDRGRIMLRDATDLRLLRDLQAHQGRIRAALFLKGGRLLTAGEDGQVRIWDASTLQPVSTLRGSENAVFAAAVSADGTRAATGGEDGVVHVWDIASGQEVATLSGHEGVVRAVAFSPDGKMIATSSEDRTARLWDAQSGDALGVLDYHTQGVGGVSFSPDGRDLMTTGDDGLVLLWDAHTHTVRVIMDARGGAAYSGAFSADGARLATAHDDGVVRVWDRRDGRLMAALTGIRGAAFGVAFSPDGARLAGAGEGGRVFLWDVRRLTQDWAGLAKDACSLFLSAYARRFTRAAIDADPLLASEWGDPERDVCRYVRDAPSIATLRRQAGLAN